MKKILLASTILVGFAGAVSAEVTLSGAGRFGLQYYSGTVVGFNKTVLDTRLRFNIDAKTTTDSGVEFGGRIRLQYDDGAGAAALSPAQVYAQYNGMRLEVGNVNTAYDSVALMYNSEMGYTGSSAGDPRGSFYSFSSGAYAASRMGIFFGYSAGDLNARISYVTPDQYTSVLPVGVKEEVGVSVDYKFGQFTVAAAAVMNGNGINRNDQFFVGAEYAATPAANIGLLYFDEGDLNGVAVGDEGRTITLYGNYNFGATTVRAFVANNNNVANLTDTSYGIGADYDLGGATLAGMVQRDYAKETYVEVGVGFKF